MLTRRKSSSSSDHEGFTIYNRSTTVDEPQEPQQRRSVIATLLSPLGTIEDSISPLLQTSEEESSFDPLASPDMLSDDGSKGFQMIDVSSKVVAEECSSDEEGSEEEDDGDYEGVLSPDEEESDQLGMRTKPQEQLVVVDKPGFRKRLALIRQRRRQAAANKKPRQEIDVQAYMSKREMTATQERWNAITVVPNPIFCFYFLLSGLWVSAELVNQVRQEMSSGGSPGSGDEYDFSSSSTAMQQGGFQGFANAMLGDSRGCLNTNENSSSWWSWGHSMPALPPITAMAVTLGITLHAPFSVLYHWKYAHSLPAGAARTHHWSRRMDQSMIHVASALIAYGTSGSWDFFVANVLYNADCIYRQFQDKVRPRSNKVRLFISIICYTMPIVCRKSAQMPDDLILFVKLWCVLGVSGWFFALYPIGGWSHAVFHLVAMLIPPLLMTAACRLPVAQEQMKLAAQCVVLAEQQQQATFMLT